MYAINFSSSIIWTTSFSEALQESVNAYLSDISLCPKLYGGTPATIVYEIDNDALTTSIVATLFLGVADLTTANRVAYYLAKDTGSVVQSKYQALGAPVSTMVWTTQNTQALVTLPMVQNFYPPAPPLPPPAPPGQAYQVPS